MTTTLRGWQTGQARAGYNPNNGEEAYRDLAAVGGKLARYLIYPDKIMNGAVREMHYGGIGSQIREWADVRRPLLAASSVRDMPDGYSFSDETLEMIDEHVAWSEKYGLTAIISVQLGSEDIGSKDGELWHDANLQGSLCRLWTDLATRYNGRACWFDLLNEPVFYGDAVASREQGYTTVMQPVCDAIRDVSWNHIVWQSSPGSMAHTFNFAPPRCANLIGSPHMYWPHKLTHNGVGGFPFDPAWVYPCPPPPEGVYEMNKDRLRDPAGGALDVSRDWGDKYQTPMVVGEFSCVRWAPGDSRFRYMEDCVDLFEKEYGWLGWIICAWRTWPGWDMEMADQTPPTDPEFDLSDHPRNAYSNEMTLLRRYIPPR
jgi:hypothetical protein